jgi:hypothetical protein
MAVGLCASERAARRIVPPALRQTIRIFYIRKIELHPGGWLLHQTLLASRPAAATPVNPTDDPLVGTAEPAEAAYVAWIRAIRHLPRQQQEAFLLHHGLGFDQRDLGIAMDCSTVAAANHLRAAHAAIAPLEEGRQQEWIERLQKTMASFDPPRINMEAQVARGAAQVRLIRTARTALRILRNLVVMAAVAVVVWHFREPIADWFKSLQSVPAGATSQPSAPTSQPTATQAR